MNASAFNKGQTVYILNMYERRGKETKITPATVEKIGRRYVTLTNGRRYTEQEYFEFGLVETSDYGEKTFLCPSKTDAKMYIEKYNIVLWLRRLNIDINSYTLKQLRDVIKILDC